ncbi:MAG: nickel pincer cofactor biosynthesis protein LarC [bacterium]
MRIGYFDCFSGASGDMICASLIDAGARVDVIEAELGKIGVGKIEIVTEEVMRKGIRARLFRYKCQSEFRLKDYGDFRDLLEQSGLRDSTKKKALTILELLAEAESYIHGVPLSKVHFHEIGSIDTIVDIVTAVVGLEALGIGEVTSSPLPMGMGKIECEHGILPSPAPATLELVRGMPIRGLPVDAELTTPTGAAIIKACAAKLGEMPPIKPIAVGYGTGCNDFEEIPNVMRFIVGEEQDYDYDHVTILETNIDDINPQIFPSLIEDLLKEGALDAWVYGVVMKYGRPGFCLSVIVEPHLVSKVVSKIFLETTTSGVRIKNMDRIKLPRRIVEVETKYGCIRVKVFESDCGIKYVPEYRDCLDVARRLGLPVSQVIEEAKHAFRLQENDR